jgi:hypothetical protein
MATESTNTDPDYQDLKVWQYDQDALIKQSINLGGPYEGILEAVQNALDSPMDRFHDYNRIDITIPQVDMPDYGKFIARVSDTGGSITKDFEGQIAGYISFIRAISPKKEHRFGVGMGQYFNVAPKFVMTSMDDALIYRIPNVLTSSGRPATGNWTQTVISPKSKEKYNIFSKGTVIEWYGKTSELSPTKVGHLIQKTFGWRMLEQERTDVFINGMKLALPDSLKDKHVKFICKLNQHEVLTPKGMIKVNPVVVGFIYKNNKGTGHLEVYAGGGYYFKREKFAHKRFDGAIYIQEMPFDTSRHTITHESMWLDLERHIKEETKHFPDIPEDDSVTEKQHKSMSDVINRVLKRFNIPKLQILKFESDKKKRIEEKGTPIEDGILVGYQKHISQKPVVQLCDLCGHYMVKNTRGKRKGCTCDCHIPRPKGPDKEHGTVILEGEIPVMIEEDNIQNRKERSELQVRLVKDSIGSNPPFLELLPDGYLDIHTGNPLFTRLDIVKHVENIFPFLANIVVDLEHPDAFTEQSPPEYRKLIEDYTIQMLDDV